MSIEERNKIREIMDKRKDSTIIFRPVENPKILEEMKKNRGRRHSK